MARLIPTSTLTTSSVSIGGGFIEVDTYSILETQYPPASNAGRIAYVKTTTGAWNPFVTKRPSGWYRSNGVIWDDTTSDRDIELWNASVTYEQGQVVFTEDGVFYIAVQTTSGDDPTIDGGANWKKLDIDATNQYYVSNGGDNTEDGLTRNRAVQDFSTALGLASSGDTIYCEDASSFNEDINGVSGVNIYAPKATLSMTSNNSLTMEAGVYVFDTVEGDNNNSLILNNATSGYGLVVANNVHLLSGGSGVAIRNQVGRLLDVKVKQFAIIGSGDGVGDFTGVAAHTHIEIDDFYLHSTGDAISVNNGGEVVGTVQHCSCVAGGSGSFVNVTDGAVDLKCNLIESDINVGASGTANLNIGKMTGDITVASGGTLYINCPEFTGTLNNSGTIFGQLGDIFYGENTYVNTQTFSQTALSKQSLAPTGTTQTIDFDSGSYVDLDVSGASGDVTLTLNNPTTAGFYTIEVSQGATARDIIFPAGTLQAGGGGATITGIASATQVIDVVYNGSIYLITTQSYS